MLQVFVKKLLRQLRNADADEGNCSKRTRLRSLDLYISFSICTCKPEPTPTERFWGVLPIPKCKLEAIGESPPPPPPPPPMVVVEDDDDPGDDVGLHERKAALPCEPDWDGWLCF